MFFAGKEVIMYNNKCSKCKNINCLTEPDRDNWCYCIHCGSDQEMKEAPENLRKHKKLKDTQ